MLQLETPETQLAKDFADIYVQLVSDSTDSSAEGSVIGGANYSFEGEERILTLHAVADLVINFLRYHHLKWCGICIASIVTSNQGFLSWVSQKNDKEDVKWSEI